MDKTWREWQQCACSPGGWDAAHIDRKKAWYASTVLTHCRFSCLHAEDVSPPPTIDTLPHKDEGQLDLDVQRSFYTHKDERPVHMDQLRTHLRAMISTTLRTYPALHYFQGLHDIVAILLLTLCPGSKEEPVSNDDLVKLQNVVNYVCLHFVRDSMTRDLMPAMSHLKVVRNILRAADAPYAYALERVFYPNHVVVVLSWMLTLFTHDMPTLSSAQRILDFVWTHGPASTAYVCAALLLSRKDQVAQKASEQHRSVDELELPVLHQILSGAPEALGRDEMLMERVLQHAGTLMDTYSLRCPAVRAHLIVGQDSVLFTWPHVSTTENAVRILSLPTPQLALDPMPTPREEKLAQMPNTLKKPRTAEILWQVIQRRRAPYLWLYPRILTMSAMSLLFSGGLATFLLAIFLADRPRM